MPENYLTYLDELIVTTRASLNTALDHFMDDRIALAHSARLHALLEVKAEASDYEPA